MALPPEPAVPPLSPPPPPDDLFAPPSAHGRKPRRGLVVAACAAAMLIGVSTFAGVSAASSGVRGYRTAVVSTEDVQRTLDGVGTLEPVDQAAVAFPVSGTVSEVDVSVGSDVVAGQPLATLDTQALETSLHTAEAQRDSAALSLQKALNGESTSSGGSGSTLSSSSSSSSGSGATVTPAVYSGSTSSTATAAAIDSGSDLSLARSDVAAAQHALDDAIAASSAALANATTACGTTDATAGGSSSTTSTSTSTTTPAAGSTGCQDALAAAVAAQQQVADANHALQDAVARLDALSSSGSSGSSGSASTGSSGSSSSSGSGTGSTGSTGSTVSSADLIAAQKALDAADADVAVAQQALDQATIVSPIAGEVTAVAIKAGQSVSAASTTQIIRIAGPDGFQITTSVAVTALPHVSVGQSATIVPDGSTAELAATVVSIGLLANSSGTSTTYPVVLSLADPVGSLPDGGLASVSIVTGDTRGVTAVPTSAVTTSTTGHTVVVVDGGKTSTVDVQVGTVGSRWTEVTGGLEVGQVVVLADLSEALPGTATSGSTASSTGAAGAGTRTGAFRSAQSSSGRGS